MEKVPQVQVERGAKFTVDGMWVEIEYQGEMLRVPLGDARAFAHKITPAFIPPEK